MARMVRLRFYCGRGLMTSVLYFEDSRDGFWLLKNILWLYVRHGWSIVGYEDDFEAAATSAWDGREPFLSYVGGDCGG